MNECRVHSCVFQQRVVAQKSEPDPQRPCKCRKLVSQEKAKDMVDCGEATFQVIARERKEQYKLCKICDGGDAKSSCLECKKTGKVLDVQVNEVFGRDIVKIVFQTKTNRVSTPRVPTIEAKHILRAYVSNESRELVDSIITVGAWGVIGYISSEQRKTAVERIEEYGRLIREARECPGPSECKHRKEFKCSRCEVPAGQKVNVIGVEPKNNEAKGEGERYDWGRVV